MTLTDPHLMVDVETYSQRSNGVIRSIGAVLFDPLTGQFDNDYQFHIGVELESSVLAGLHIEEETVKWWRDQKDNLYRLTSLTPLEPIGSALYAFKNRYREFDMEKLRVWSHGSSFDTVLLSNAYKAIGEKEWWKYSNVRDTRTLFDCVGYQYKAKGEHDALRDAINQAQAVCECWQRLPEKKFGVLGVAGKEDHQSHIVEKGWKESYEKKGE